MMIMDIMARFVLTMGVVNWSHFIGPVYLIVYVWRLFDDGLKLKILMHQSVSFVSSCWGHWLGIFGRCHLAADIFSKLLILFARSELVDDQQTDANGQQEGTGAQEILPVAVGVARNGATYDEHGTHEEKDDTDVETGNSAETFLVACSSGFAAIANYAATRCRR